MDIPFGQCGHFNHIGLLWPSKKPHFLIMMVFNKWQNGILVVFIVNGKSRESDLDPILQTLSKCMPSSWMPNVIRVDNVQAKSMC